MSEVNPLQLSDDDFLNGAPPVVVADEAADPVVEEAEEQENQDAGDAGTGADADANAADPGDAATGDAVDDGGSASEEAEADAKAKAKPALALADADVGNEPPKIEKQTDKPEGNDPAGSDKVTKDSASKPDASGADVDPATAEAGAEKAEEKPVDYEGFYKQIMKPFKANGKTIELRDPAEAIQLMQMGANYTRKLQDIQPHRKMLLMLQNNDLLDEGKLSFLIDLDKKNPEAIKKLIQDSGIDPLDIDTAGEPTYQGSNHSVSDEEANFRSSIEELSSADNGRETLAEINTRWDETSKEVLWKSPEIMTVIHEQRENGIYAVITAEVDRQITLGQIPPNTPFLEAYKSVGDQMAQEALKTTGSGKSEAETVSNPVKEPQVLDTRVAAPTSKVANGEQASAASPSRSTQKTAKSTVNPLAMSDDAFLKQMENRL